MKLNTKETLGKLLAKAQEDKKATMKFIGLIVIIILGMNYPMMMAIIGGIAIMVAIDKGSEGKKSLDFLKVPVDAIKIVSSDIQAGLKKDDGKKEEAPKAAEAQVNSVEETVKVEKKD